MVKNHPNYDTFKQVILEYIRGKKYLPLTEKELFKKLSISPKFQALCRMILEDLQQEGVLKLSKKKFVLHGPPRELMTGTIRVHAKGFGFVIPDHRIQYPQDIFIPKHLTESAVDGDRVEVEVNATSTSDKGPEGKVIAVLERGRTHIGATIHHIAAVKGTQRIAYAYSPLLGSSKLIAVTPKKKTVIGDRVIIKVQSWGHDKEAPEGEISHFLGHISDPSCDIQCAIEEFDLHSVFPPEALDQTADWGREVQKSELKKREDLTGITTMTIDPETAKDFDDALSISKDKKGIYHLGVHIADVAHYVPVDSPLDLEAVVRGNSTYFPGYCLPMLPHELSDHLCSLQPDVIRLTVSVLADFDKEGNMLGYRITRSYIKSAKRFSYEEAKEVLDGELKSPHLNELKLMVELCHLLKKKRHDRGSIDFALPELVIIVDEKGQPHKTKRVEYDITHQLVEEFMLKANEIVAKHLSDKGKPVVFRVHEAPEKEDFEDFYALARSLGFSLPASPEQRDIQELFEKAQKTPFAQQLAVAFIRSMNLAIYSSENVGHYGLALEYYTHFTSPIRRYTDLVIQRLLFDQEGKDLQADKIAERCSERERISFRAESSVKLLKKLRLMDHWMKEEPLEVYEALITRIKPFGFFFELSHLMLEGFLHISELDNDYFVYNEAQNILIGRTAGKTYRAGDTIKVRPSAIDLVLLESKWELDLPKKQRRRAK
ncbi:MAG: ribonuclease R [Verrucomicrobia bacterium]|nr:ribonuclease R [Verrucomicrobiota bacterium]